MHVICIKKIVLKRAFVYEGINQAVMPQRGSGLCWIATHDSNIHGSSWIVKNAEKDS